MGIFTKTQERVLRVLFGNIDQDFTVTEVIRATRSGSGAVQREIAKLAKEHLVTMTPVGNQKRYQANPQHPIFEELRRIIMKSGHIVRQTPRAAPEPDFVD